MSPESCSSYHQKGFGRITWAITGMALMSSSMGCFSAQVRSSEQTKAPEPLLENLEIINPGIDRRPGQRLSIEDGVVTAIGSASASDAKMLYALPGIINMHAHLPPKVPLPLTELNLLLFLRHGVTTIREAGDLDGTAISHAQSLQKEEGLSFPRVLHCGPFVAGAPSRFENTVVIHSEEEARSTVRELHQQGHTCVKSYEDLSVAMIAALVDEAAKFDMQVIGHVPEALRVEDSGLPEPQHFLGIPEPKNIPSDRGILGRFNSWDEVDDARIQTIVDDALAKNVIHTPTLVVTKSLSELAEYDALLKEPKASLAPNMFTKVVWHPQEGIPFFRNIPAAETERLRRAMDIKLKTLKRLHDAGATVLVGTDTGQPFVVAGASTWEEMQLFAKAGLSAEEVWAASTWKAAEVLKRPDLGRIEKGAKADVLLFEKDPTTSLDNLKTLTAVVSGGKLYRVEDVDRAVDDVLGFFNNPVVDAVARWVARQELKKLGES